MINRMFATVLICVPLGLGACTKPSTSIETAQPFVGLQERQDRKYLRDLVGVDPVRTEWCAAFVNAVLEIDDIPGSESVSDNPLMARSFLSWGETVQSADVQRGDIVVFPRGRAGWQGHVGFYVETRIQDGVEYWVILGGNQSNQVRYDLYPANRALGIRRWPQQNLDQQRLSFLASRSTE